MNRRHRQVLSRINEHCGFILLEESLKKRIFVIKFSKLSLRCRGTHCVRGRRVTHLSSHKKNEKIKFYNISESLGLVIGNTSRPIQAWNLNLEDYICSFNSCVCVDEERCEDLFSLMRRYIAKN